MIYLLDLIEPRGSFLRHAPGLWLIMKNGVLNDSRAVKDPANEKLNRYGT